MKYLVIAEGTTDKALVDVLIDHHLFLYEIQDLLLEETFHCRQLSDKPAIIDAIRQLPFEEKVSIVRVGDTLTDELKKPSTISMKISDVEDYHILPELEVLIIIAEKRYTNYLKFKSRLRPKEYVENQIHFKGDQYDCSKEWISDYFGSMADSRIIDLFSSYHKKRGNAKKREKGISCLVKGVKI
jgi:hypothetical protein